MAKKLEMPEEIEKIAETFQKFLLEEKQIKPISAAVYALALTRADTYWRLEKLKAAADAENRPASANQLRTAIRHYEVFCRRAQKVEEEREKSIQLPMEEKIQFPAEEKIAQWVEEEKARKKGLDSRIIGSILLQARLAGVPPRTIAAIQRLGHSFQTCVLEATSTQDLTLRLCLLPQPRIVEQAWRFLRKAAQMEQGKFPEIERHLFVPGFDGPTKPLLKFFSRLQIGASLTNIETERLLWSQVAFWKDWAFISVNAPFTVATDEEGFLLDPPTRQALGSVRALSKAPFDEFFAACEGTWVRKLGERVFAGLELSAEILPALEEIRRQVRLTGQDRRDENLILGAPVVLQPETFEAVPPQNVVFGVGDPTEWAKLHEGLLKFKGQAEAATYRTEIPGPMNPKESFQDRKAGPPPEKTNFQPEERSYQAGKKKALNLPRESENEADLEELLRLTRRLSSC